MNSAPSFRALDRVQSHAANRQLCYFSLIALAVLLASGLAHAAEGTSLPLNEYLSQVRQGNTGTQGAVEAASAQKQRSNEGELLLAPTAFANIQYSHDGKPQIIPLTTYSFQDIWQYSLGVSKTTTFGLTAKLSTNMYLINYTNPSSFFSYFAADPYLAAIAAAPAYPGTVNFTNQIELTQSLWGNGFGATTRANQDLTEAQALSQSYGNRYTARSQLVDAENAYWKLATARQAVELTLANLDRAQKTYDWNVRRVHLQLADESDALQSQAQLEARKLEYQTAQDNEVIAARAFNTARGVPSDAVAERLAPLTPETILAMQAPKRAEYRDDVKAAQEQSRATVASDTIARERAKPTFDLFGTAGLNGQSISDVAYAYQQAVSTDHPTITVGLRFQAPLDLGTASATRAAYTREEAAADLTYQRKVFEQEQGWKDLVDRLNQSRRRLQLSVNLEKVQQAKLYRERERYNTGRTTVFQVLTFETDFAQSELNRLTAQSDVLGILTQMKLYGEEL